MVVKNPRDQKPHQQVDEADFLRCTYPAYWSGQLFLNVSGDGTASAIGPASNPGSTSVDARGTPLPPNALATTLLEYDEKNGDGWEVDYPVDMPEGVSDRRVLSGLCAGYGHDEGVLVSSRRGKLKAGIGVEGKL